MLLKKVKLIKEIIQDISWVKGLEGENIVLNYLNTFFPEIIMFFMILHYQIKRVILMMLLLDQLDYS